MDFILDPNKVKAILEMSEDMFEEYKYALIKYGKITEIERG